MDHSRTVRAITNVLIVIGLLAVLGAIGLAVIWPPVFGLLLLGGLIGFGLVVGKG